MKVSFELLKQTKEFRILIEAENESEAALLELAQYKMATTGEMSAASQLCVDISYDQNR